MDIKIIFALLLAFPWVSYAQGRMELQEEMLKVEQQQLMILQQMQLDKWHEKREREHKEFMEAASSFLSNQKSEEQLRFERACIEFRKLSENGRKEVKRKYKNKYNRDFVECD